MPIRQHWRLRSRCIDLINDAPKEVLESIEDGIKETIEHYNKYQKGREPVQHEEELDGYTITEKRLISETKS